MSDDKDQARDAAVRAMTAVTEEGVTLGDVLPRLTAPLPPGDAARAGRLATEALRWANRSDRLLGPHIRMKPEDPVMHALRLAIYELFEEGAAPHGVVNAAVSLVTRSKAGLVNGVLRNVLRRESDWSSLPVPQTPKWLRKRLVSAWGKATVAAMEEVHAQRPPLDITCRTDPEGWAERLGGQVMPGGSVRLAPGAQVSALEGYTDGAWWVQDAGATVAVNALAPQQGMRVLDLCAAPGGKTMQLAAAGASVTALDVSKGRMARVRENLERTGLAAECVVADALNWVPDQLFDTVLLDAPCSATGTLRRHPDLVFARDGSGIDDLVALQAKLLDRAGQFLKPGGRLVYCTCSLLPEEGEKQIDAFVERSGGYTLMAPPTVDPQWNVLQGLRLRPDHWAERGGIDGFFVACLEKRS
ncbi:MAG: RsmB/NOP family class I SAM-dependent RNA methyltransferase [Paracoccaceae bacterium]